MGETPDWGISEDELDALKKSAERQPDPAERLRQAIQDSDALALESQYPDIAEEGGSEYA